MKLVILMSLLILIYPNSNAQSINFTKHNPCTFTIELPTTMKLTLMWESSPDYCDYIVSLNDGFSIIELHSLNNARFNYDAIKDLYQAAIRGSKLNVTYKAQSSNWFIISGINKENGNIVYWKRILGTDFISDLHIEYPPSRKSQIEKYIGRISKSFLSD